MNLFYFGGNISGEIFTAQMHEEKKEDINFIKPDRYTSTSEFDR